MQKNGTIRSLRLFIKKCFLQSIFLVLKILEFRCYKHRRSHDFSDSYYFSRFVLHFFIYFNYLVSFGVLCFLCVWFYVCGFLLFVFVFSLFLLFLLCLFVLHCWVSLNTRGIHLSKWIQIHSGVLKILHILHLSISGSFISAWPSSPVCEIMLTCACTCAFWYNLILYVV